MKIGIIHTAFIGDIVLTGLLIEGLYQTKHEIIFFTKSKTSQIVQNDQRISKVVILNKPNNFKRFFFLKQMIAQIRAEHLDVLICPHRSLTTTLCAYFSGVPLTIGFQNATLSGLYKITKPYEQDMHEYLRYFSLIPDTICDRATLDLVRQIGRPILRPKKISTQSNIYNENKEYFIIALGSVWASKKYISSYMLEICEYILSAYPTLTCYLTGDQNDTELCEKFLKNINKSHKTRVINTAGQLNIPHFLNIIQHAKFILSNDSSPLHLASAFNVPIIAFWGPTSSEVGFGPLSEKQLVISHKTLFGHNLPCQPCGTHGAKKCPKKHHLCMKKMTPQLVIPKIKQFLRSFIV